MAEFVDPAITRITEDRARKVAKAPGIDMDTIHWKRGAIDPRLALEGRSAYERRQRSKLTRRSEQE